MKKKILILFPIIIIILIALWILGDELIIRPKRIQQSEQGLTLACVGVYKSSINLHHALYGRYPDSIEEVGLELKKEEGLRLNVESVEKCLLSTPINYQKRINGKGYKISYKDAWGKDQVIELDSEKDYAQ